MTNDKCLPYKIDACQYRQYRAGDNFERILHKALIMNMTTSNQTKSIILRDGAILAIPGNQAARPIRFSDA